MIELNEVLMKVKAWAKAVGTIQNDNLGKKDMLIHTKSSGIDLVTEVDEQSERYIISKIKENYPTHDILSEESGRAEIDSDYQWIIDPLDGTTNYAQGLPIFAISIALQYRGETVLGVVYIPSLKEMFVTIKGQGAFLNDNRIKVSQKNEFKECVLATGFPYDRAIDKDNNVDYFLKMITKVRGIRRMGAAAYDLANVAAGRLDGYWELKLSVWDVAAGILLVEEAGGKVRHIPNKREISIIAANQELCDHLYNEITDSN